MIYKARWLSWLERRPVTAEVAGSSPARVVYILYILFYGILAQLGEHLPYKQRVIGSSPIGPILKVILSDAAVAELADAQDLKSCGGDIVPVRFRSAAGRVCVAQLDRALGYGPRCRGFESSHARLLQKRLGQNVLVFFCNEPAARSSKGFELSAA